MNTRLRQLFRLASVLLLIVAVFTVVSAALAQMQPLVIDGSPGSSVPPNTAPPRPVNPREDFRFSRGYLVVDTDNLSLRSGPDARYTLVGVLDGGTYLEVLGSNGDFEGNLWWFVEVGDLRGWVANEFVAIRGNLEGLPIAEDEGVVARPLFYIGGLNPLYPNRIDPSVCLVGGNEFYYVTGVDSAGDEPSWVQIEAVCNGQTVEGWVQFERGLLRNTGQVLIPVVDF